jgi:hypothetical protein
VKLNEFYIKYDFNWIVDLVEDLYNVSSITNDEIEKKYDCIIETKNEQGDSRLVLLSSFDMELKKYRIILNSFKLSNEKYDGELKLDLIDELRRNLVHEDTHRQQFQCDPKYLEQPDPNANRKKYLSSQQEIDARAREVAYYFENNGINSSKAMELVNILDNKLGPYLRIVWEYRDINGEIFKKFKNEIYRYLENEEK